MFRRRSLLALSLLLLVGLIPLVASAAYKDNFPAQPGFTHSPLGPDDPGAGKQLPGGGTIIYRGSPTIAEIDPNTTGKEIAVGDNDGWLYVFHKDGSLAWRQNVLPGGAGSCTIPAGDGLLNSAPAVGELFADGVPYVVVSYGTITTNCIGGVVAYDGRNGNVKWRYQLTNSGEALHGALSSPALADVDGDGKLEVGFGNFERDMVMLNTDGTKRWRYHNADTVWSSPAFSDVDGDGLPDMIIGSDISANPRAKPQPTLNGGYITALRGTDSTMLWRVYFDQTIFSSPVLVDLDSDGAKEVVIGSGCYFSPATNGHWLKILDLHTGATIRTLNANGCVSSTPAVGDIDGDGQLEIVASVNGAKNNPPTPGVIQAWEYTNPTPKWTIDPRNSNANLNDGNIDDIMSPVLADIDGNGSLEVIVANMTDVTVLRGDNGAQLTCRSCNDATNSLFTFYTLKSTPAVGDIDGDGDLEVVIGGGNRNGVAGGGYLFVWTDFAGLLGSPSGSLPPYSTPWPMFHGNPRHTGIFARPELLAAGTSVTLLTPKDGPARTFGVALTDAAEGAIDWSAAKDQAWISLGATSGTTPETLQITIDPAGASLGTQTGTVTLTSAFGSVTIDVTLQVVDTVYDVHLPLVQR